MKDQCVLYEQIYEYPNDLIKTLSKYLFWIICLYKSNFIWGRKHIIAAHVIQHVHKTSISGFVYGCVGWNKHCEWTWTSNRQQGSTILQQKEKNCSQCLGSMEKCRKKSARGDHSHQPETGIDWTCHPLWKYPRWSLRRTWDIRTSTLEGVEVGAVCHSSDIIRSAACETGWTALPPCCCLKTRYEQE